MRTKEITVELKLVAQPKQFHSLTVGVSATVEADEDEPTRLELTITALRKRLSEELTTGIHEEIKKLYGPAAADAALAGYFQQGGKV